MSDIQSSDDRNEAIRTTPPRRLEVIQGSLRSLRPYLWATSIALVLTAATVAAYWPAFSCGFINYDDNVYVTENTNVRPGLSLDAVKWAFTTTYAVNWHPLSWLSFQLDAQLYGPDNPFGFHLTNVILHIANMLLLFYALTRMTGRMWRSAFVAALFALHPLHVESVAWVAERKDVLSTLFGMLALAAYAHYALCPHWTTYLLTVLAFALSLMAKSMLVTLPCLLLLLDFWPLRRFPGLARRATAEAAPAVSWRRLIVEKIPLLLLSAASAAVTMYAQQEGHVEDPVTRMVRVENAFTAYLTYLEKTFWPAGLIPFYPLRTDLLYPSWVEAAALLAGITLLVLLLARRRPYLAVGWFWFLGTLAPVIGVVPVIGGHALADRYTYVPLIGLFLALVWGAAEGLARAGVRPWAPTLVGAVLLAACLVGTREQVGYWHNNDSLWTHTLQVDPKNHLAYNNLANLRYCEGKYADADRLFRKAIECDPQYDPIHYGLSYHSLAMTLVQEGKIDEAVAAGEAAVRLQPMVADYQYYLGWMLLVKLRARDAIPHLEAAVNAAPSYTVAQADLGWAYYLQGRDDEAAVHLREAVRQAPHWAVAQYDLGLGFDGPGGRGRGGGRVRGGPGVRSERRRHTRQPGDGLVAAGQDGRGEPAFGGGAAAAVPAAVKGAGGLASKWARSASFHDPAADRRSSL